MKIFKLVFILFIGTLVFTSCDTDDPIEETVSKLSLISTAVLNDENEDGFAQIGETITYTFMVSNTGDNTVSSIVLNDERLGVENLALHPSELTAGENASITVVYTIVIADFESNSITNQAIVTGLDAEGTEITDLSDDNSNDEDDATVTTFEVLLVSKLGVIATAVFNDGNTDGFAQVGELITYIYTVTNIGETTISGLVINDATIGVENLALAPSELVVGESASINVDYTLLLSDIENNAITNQATVTGVNPDGEEITDLSDDSSNDEDDETTISYEVIPFQYGYFITNEGNFGAGNGSLTFVASNGTVSHNVFSTVNGMSLGDTVQSIFFHENNAYIVVNNSHKIIVVNRYTMELITTIDGGNINNPRYFVADGTTGYISNWGSTSSSADDFIAVVDLNTNTVTSTIAVGEGPEDMLISNSKVYVNLQGGWGQNNQVVIIDTASNTVLSNLTVGDSPNSITKDSSGNIWVLCGGKPSWTGSETMGKLVKIQNDTVDLTIDFSVANHPEHLTFDNNSLYYTLNGEVYSREVASVFTSNQVMGLGGYYYGMKANNGNLYTLDAGDFSSEGSLKVYNIATQTVENTIITGIIPGYIAFNQ